MENILQKEETTLSDIEDYTSHNTVRLDVEQTKNFLKLNFIQEAQMLKVMTVVGTGPEIIRLSRIIPILDKF